MVPRPPTAQTLFASAPQTLFSGGVGRVVVLLFCRVQTVPVHFMSFENGSLRRAEVSTFPEMEHSNRASLEGFG